MGLTVNETFQNQNTEMLNSMFYMYFYCYQRDYKWIKKKHQASTLQQIADHVCQRAKQSEFQLHPQGPLSHCLAKKSNMAATAQAVEAKESPQKIYTIIIDDPNILDEQLWNLNWFLTLV